MEIKLGDKYTLNVTETSMIDIEITKLGTKEIEFLVSGEDVKNPDEPRIMGVASFVGWLKAMLHNSDQITNNESNEPIDLVYEAAYAFVVEMDRRFGREYQGGVRLWDSFGEPIFDLNEMMQAIEEGRWPVAWSQEQLEVAYAA